MMSASMFRAATFALLQTTAAFHIVPPPVPSTAIASIGSLLALADPFADPVFNTAIVHETTAAVAPAAQQAAATGFSQQDIIWGLSFYVASMSVLTWWDERVLPKLQDKGVMPEMPGSLRAQRLKKLTKEQRATPWTTPLTSDRGLPSLNAVEKEAVRVSQSKNGVIQFIKAHTAAEHLDSSVHTGRPTDGTEFEADEMNAVCRVSTEFSEHFGKRVYICKRAVDTTADKKAGSESYAA